MGSRDIKSSEKTHFDLMGKRYDERWVEGRRFATHYSRIIEDVTKHMEKQRQNRILDMGCGTGRGLLLLAHMGFSVVGVDLSIGLLRIARQKALGSNAVDSVDLIKGDAENLCLIDEEFDMVTFWGVLHHLPDKKKAVQESYESLKPGGILVIHEPNRSSSRMIWRMAFLVNIPAFLLGKIAKKGPPIESEVEARDFSEFEATLELDEIEELLRRASFEIIERRRVWFFGMIPLDYSERVTSIYYRIANAIDAKLEKTQAFAGGAILIVARRRGNWPSPHPEEKTEMDVRS